MLGCMKVCETVPEVESNMADRYREIWEKVYIFSLDLFFGIRLFSKVYDPTMFKMPILMHAYLRRATAVAQKKDAGPPYRQRPIRIFSFTFHKRSLEGDYFQNGRP